MVSPISLGGNLYDSGARQAGAACRNVKKDNITIVTPKVREAVREQFSCGSADGAQLEDGGGEGTEGSHWEASNYLGELMAGARSHALAH